MTRLHHDYIHQVLRDRGVRSPDMAALRAYSDCVDRMPVHQAEAAAATMQRMAMGVEGNGELEALLQEISAASANAAVAPLAAARTVAHEEQRGARATSGTEADPACAAPHERGASEAGPLDTKLVLLRQHGMHVYGKSAALKIELSQLRASEDDPALPQYTLQLEGATSAAGRYDWRRKIVFQLTRRELPLLAAFLLGNAGPGLSFGNHGPGNDKQLDIEDQGRHCFVRLKATGHPLVTVPVTPPDLFAWGELALVALHLNRPLLAAESQLALLRRLGDMVRPSEAPA